MLMSQMSERLSRSQMSMEEEVWTQRLEKFGLASTAISLFAGIGVDNNYNVALGLFAVYSSYSRNGRINLASGGLIALSVIVDIVLYVPLSVFRLPQYQ